MPMTSADVLKNYLLTTGFHYGPRFDKIVRADTELRDLVFDGLYQDALDVLDRRIAWLPSSRSARSLVRCYLLLGLGRVLESWKEIQALDSPEHELLYSLGLKAQNRAFDEGNEEARAAEILDAGLQALTRALELKEGAYWTLFVKSGLLRQKASLAGGEAERKRLLDEAEKLHERARAMQPKPGPPKS